MDWALFSAVLLLVLFGLVEIYSVSLGRGGIDLQNFRKQILFIVVGFLLMFFLAFADYHLLRSFSNYFFLAGVLSLILVLIFGREINGTKGWFYFQGFSIQPVEFVKFILILFLARYFSSASIKLNPLRHFAITGGGTLILFILVLAQPDFGSALLLFLLWLAVIILAGSERKYLIAIFLIVAVIAAGFWVFYFKPYQKQRIATFLNPSFDPLGQGFNISQAIIAVGSGGLSGRGIGFGSQSQLKFLPESQTDFIFAVISEELGFLGAGLVLAFFAVFFYRCLASLKKINNDFGIFFILGVVSLIFIEMFINIAMNMGLLPVIGISLPFLSYGGSTMIANMMLVGVVQSIIIRSKLSY
jgi:rod shape determining protein RodA